VYVFEYAGMYYGKPPVIEIDKILGITTLEPGLSAFNTSLT
jgi:hypothetical protein